MKGVTWQTDLILCSPQHEITIGKFKREHSRLSPEIENRHDCGKIMKLHSRTLRTLCRISAQLDLCLAFCIRFVSHSKIHVPTFHHISIVYGCGSPFFVDTFIVLHEAHIEMCLKRTIYVHNHTHTRTHPTESFEYYAIFNKVSFHFFHLTTARPDMCSSIAFVAHV